MSNRRLQDLTMEELNKVLIPGTVLAYSDMSNVWSERFVIAREQSFLDGQDVVILYNPEASHNHKEVAYYLYSWQYGWELVRIADAN